MFILLKIKDIIEVEPAYFCSVASWDAAEHSPTGPAPFGKEEPGGGECPYYIPTSADVLHHRISERYVAKVIPQQGYCIAIRDVERHAHQIIRGDVGSCWTTVVFNAVVFRPHIAERLLATIHRQDPGGIALSVEFFNCIFVPKHLLIPGSRFNASRGKWELCVFDEDTNEASSINEYRDGDLVLFAVKNVVVRNAVEAAQADAEAASTKSALEKAHDESIMSVTGTFAESGLGPCAWFEDEEGSTDLTAT
jgi:DNA-directed RNA polymerase subunit E'/Rpb7